MLVPLSEAKDKQSMNKFQRLLLMGSKDTLFLHKAANTELHTLFNLQGQICFI